MESGKSALVLLADGCEEIEAVSIIDVLRRCGVEVCSASLGGGSAVAGAHSICIGADRALPGTPAEALEFAAGFDAVVLPGGMGGTLALKADGRALAVLRAAAARGAVVAAVCAAPMALDAAGVLAGRRFCCYPGVERGLAGGGVFVPGRSVVTDGNVVTGTGPGTAAAFALGVARALGRDAAGVARAMLLGDEA